MEWVAAGAALIPCYNEERTIGAIVRGARMYLPRVVVVDDGSEDGTAREAELAGAEVIRGGENRGKGWAIREGVSRLRATGCGWVVLMDGDGQHAIGDIPEFLRVAGAGGWDLIIGNRMEEAATMPRVRWWTNRLMSGVLSGISGFSLPDTQCGFRWVRLEAWSDFGSDASRFEVESEMIARFLTSGRRIGFVPIQCVYKGGGSKIRPVRDAWRWGRWVWRWYGKLRAVRKRKPISGTPE